MDGRHASPWKRSFEDWRLWLAIFTVVFHVAATWWRVWWLEEQVVEIKSKVDYIVIQSATGAAAREQILERLRMLESRR